jgi:hypothetical protein
MNRDRPMSAIAPASANRGAIPRPVTATPVPSAVRQTIFRQRRNSSAPAQAVRRKMARPLASTFVRAKAFERASRKAPSPTTPETTKAIQRTICCSSFLSSKFAAQI